MMARNRSPSGRRYPHHHNVYLDDALDAQLRRLSERSGIPVAEIIRQTLIEGLGEVERKAAAIVLRRAG